MEEVEKNFVAPLMGYPGLTKTGATVRQALQDSNAQFEALDALGRAFSPDVLFCFMDLTAEAEALGARVAFSEGQPPSVVEHSISVEEDWKAGRVLDPERDGRLRVFIRTMERMKKNLAMARGAYVTGPLTLAGEVVGIKKVLKGMIRDDRSVRRLLQFTAEVAKGYAQRLVEAGADIICILEPSAALVSPRHYHEFSKGPVEEISGSLDAITLLHICGDVTPLIPEMIKTRVHGISIDSAVDIVGVLGQLDGRMAVAGNIDPVKEMVFSTPEGVRERVVGLRMRAQQYERALVSRCHRVVGEGDDPGQGIHSNFILSTGCDLPPEVPLENIRAFMEGARESIPRNTC
jgi:uroporphyrinogen decarboxylase